MRNVWSVGGQSDRDDVNRMVVRGLLRYQLNPDWYLISSPIIAADWTQPDGQGWVVPVGGGWVARSGWPVSPCRCRWRAITTR